jgi:hypothetical protein
MSEATCPKCGWVIGEAKRCERCGFRFDLWVRPARLTQSPRPSTPHAQDMTWPKAFRAALASLIPKSLRGLGPEVAETIRTRWWGFPVLLLASVIMVGQLLWLFDPSTRTSSISRSGRPIYSGEKARLQIEGVESIGVAIDGEAFDELIQARIAHDTYGILELMLSGRVFTIENSTMALVLDGGLFKTRVRILNGRGQGKAGWVPSEWVRQP